MRYHYTLIKIATIKNITRPNDGKDMEKLNHSYIAGKNVKLYSHCGKKFKIFFKN